MPPPVQQALPNPLQFPSKIRRSSQVIWLPVWKKWNGDPLVNAAGLMPVMPIYEPVAIAVYHIIKFKPYSDAEYNAEINALNSDSWRNFTEHQCWISGIHSDGTDTIGEVNGEQVHYVVMCTDRDGGWKTLIPNAGYAYKDGTDIKSFTSTDGQPYIGSLGEDGNKADDLIILAEETKKVIAFSGVVGL